MYDADGGSGDDGCSVAADAADVSFCFGPYCDVWATCGGVASGASHSVIIQCH